MIFEHIEVLFRLLIAHILADFVLQPSKWVDHRNTFRLKSKYLYFHVAIVAILSFLAIGKSDAFGVMAVILISHFIFDTIKTYIYKESLKAFIVDQILHITVILGCWLVYTNQTNKFFESIHFHYNNKETILIATGYILITSPLSIIISKLTGKWSSEIKDEKDDENLKNAGKWIGILERFLVLTFTILGKYEAIGFLLTAKSVLRFNDIKEAKNLKRTEYIMIGTFISFALSLSIGIIIRTLINTI